MDCELGLFQLNDNLYGEYCVLWRFDSGGVSMGTGVAETVAGGEVGRRVLEVESVFTYDITMIHENHGHGDAYFDA